MSVQLRRLVIPAGHKIQTLFYLIVLSAHFAWTAGRLLPTNIENLSVDSAVNWVIYWLHRGRIIFTENVIPARQPADVVIRRPDSIVVDTVQRVNRSSWLWTWKAQWAERNSPVCERMSVDDDVGLEDDCEMREEGTGRMPWEYAGLACFEIPECEPDYDLLEPDVMANDGTIVFSRVDATDGIVLDFGEELTSDDEQDEIDGLEIGSSSPGDNGHVFTESHMQTLLKYINDLDSKTRKVVALFATQIAYTAATTALSHSREWNLRLPSVETVGGSMNTG